MAASIATFQGYISNGTSGVAGTILTVTTMTTGTIQLGMAVSNVSTTANTHIVAFRTGNGGTGTYTVSTSQSVGQSASPASFTGTTAAVITAADYNYIQNITSTVLGTPSYLNSTHYGYAQNPLVASSLAAGTTQITAAQWANLRTDLVNAYTHQGLIGGLSIPAVPTKAAAPTGSIVASEFQKYLAIANSIFANPIAVASSGQTSFVTLATQSRSTQWRSSITHTVTATWTSASALQGYFNAGGNFQFTASISGYLPTDPGYAKSVDWNTLLTNMQTISFNSNSTTCTGSYTTIASSTGFYNLTPGAAAVNIFNKTTSSSTYTPNQYDILVALDSSSTVLTFTIQFQDLSAPGGYGIDEYVTGTVTSTIKTVYASGSYVASQYPTVSNPAISGS